MRKNIAIIVPYFGRLPDHFPLWLKSCEKNSEFNWIVFTDDDREYEYPTNVNRILISFTQIRNNIQKKLGCDVALIKPYKFCDIRPFYEMCIRDRKTGQVLSMAPNFDHNIALVARGYDDLLRKSDLLMELSLIHI